MMTRSEKRYLDEALSLVNTVDTNKVRVIVQEHVDNGLNFKQAFHVAWDSVLLNPQVK